MTVKPFRSRRLQKAGVGLIWAGVALTLMPALPADDFATVHELVVLWQMHWWVKFAGVAALIVGNTLRLIGAQGHPGLPWPLFGKADVFAQARLSVRRRLSFHLRHPGAPSRREFELALR